MCSIYVECAVCRELFRFFFVAKKERKQSQLSILPSLRLTMNERKKINHFNANISITEAVTWWYTHFASALRDRVNDDKICCDDDDVNQAQYENSWLPNQKTIQMARLYCCRIQCMSAFPTAIIHFYLEVFFLFSCFTIVGCTMFIWKQSVQKHFDIINQSSFCVPIFIGLACLFS